jgi:hypothetical protein
VLVLGTVVAAAIGVQGFGLILLHHGATTHEGLAAEVRTFMDVGEPLITDAYLLPLVAGRGFFEARMLYCTGARGMEDLTARFADGSLLTWSYATVLRAPGERLGLDEVVVGADGSRWLLVDQIDRRVGSRDLKLRRYRRVAPQDVRSDTKTPPSS